MTAIPRLVAVGGPQDGREYLLDRAQIALGRDSANTVTIAWDGTVSRRHARVLCRSGLFWLEDLDSKRGTFLKLADSEERRLSSHDLILLIDGAELRLGLHARFRVLDVIASQDDALRVLLFQIKNLFHADNDVHGLPLLSEPILHPISRSGIVPRQRIVGTGNETRPTLQAALVLHLHLTLSIQRIHVGRADV